MKFIYLIFSLFFAFHSFGQHQLRQVIANPESSSSFGSYVAIEGNTLLTSNNSSDVIYVYENINGLWELQQEISPEDFTGDKNFGKRFDISNNTIIVGANYDNDDLGAVYFYEKNGSATWEQSTKVISPVASTSNSDAYWGGNYIKINGDIATATRNNGLNSLFHVLGRNQDNTWSLTDTLDIGTGWHGGATTHVSDSLIIAPSHSWLPASLNIFKKEANGKWGAPTSLTLEGSPKIDYYAINIAVDGNNMIVASPRENRVIGNDTIVGAGKVYLFQFKNGAWEYSNEIYPTTSHANEDFGYNLAIEGLTMVISASKHSFSSTGTDSLRNSGAVYVFKNENGDWIQKQKLTAYYRSSNHTFGKHIAINDGNIVVGSNNELYIFNENEDCTGLMDGSAFYDVCSNCTDGTTGYTPSTNNQNCIVLSSKKHDLEQGEVNVFPNPVNDILHLSLNSEWELFNSQGTLLNTGKGNSVDMSTLKSGLFVLKTKGASFKIIK